ncbi:MAG: hypothetical protein J0L93_06285 [Deltaproteobacteria bacterium]|nr:hypothetical protein [Deltaproteobacteria bacterium]
MSKNNSLNDLTTTSQEMKFDARLLDKKVEHGFLTRQEREAYLKALPEESEFEFTSMEEVEKEEATTI